MLTLLFNFGRFKTTDKDRGLETLGRTSGWYSVDSPKGTQTVDTH